MSKSVSKASCVNLNLWAFQVSDFNFHMTNERGAIKCQYLHQTNRVNLHWIWITWTLKFQISISTSETKFPNERGAIKCHYLHLNKRTPFNWFPLSWLNQQTKYLLQRELSLADRSAIQSSDKIHFFHCPLWFKEYLESWAWCWPFERFRSRSPGNSW